MDKKTTDGFKTLIANGLVELTGEFLVTKYRHRFSERAVLNAQERLANAPATSAPSA